MSVCGKKKLQIFFRRLPPITVYLAGEVHSAGMKDDESGGWMGRANVPAPPKEVGERGVFEALALSLITLVRREADHWAAVHVLVPL